ncbi:MAG: hypothetical protein Q8N39_10805 [Pelolinea sp.]|nr:hypothetical protein [Pelolinea sp.]
MPRTLKEFFPEKDYAGRLALGLVLLVAGQLMTFYNGVVYSVLRWVFFIVAVVNYGMILYLYQRQKQEKINAREADSKPSETPEPKK